MSATRPLRGTRRLDHRAYHQPRLNPQPHAQQHSLAATPDVGLRALTRHMATRYRTTESTAATLRDEIRAQSQLDARLTLDRPHCRH